MRIGIICYPSIGGSGLVATELGKNLAKLGHHVHFISYSCPFRLSKYEPNISFHSVDAINYPLFNQSLYTFALTAKIVEVAREYDLNVVHAHYSIPHSLCAHLAREIVGGTFGVVTTLHGTDVTIVGQDKPLYPINRYGIEKSDIVTTVSQYQRQHTLEHFRVDTDIRVIYNFIDPDAFKPYATGNTSRDQMADPDEKIIMHVSNFREPKNPIGVVRSFAKTADRINARLVLVGDGPGMTEIRQHCSELKICEKVTYLGKIDNVEDVLPLADCVFQPSYRESFGMVMLEAMACKVPVVASNADGIPEVVVDGETGILAHPDDHDALADALVRVCEDDDLAKRFANAGRKRAISNFHHSIIVPQYLETYEECAR